MSQVKIVATLGPSTNNAEMIRALQQAGMGIARLNGSHSDEEWHARTIDMIRNVAPDVPILFDIPGRKIRLGKLDEDVPVEAGELVVVSINPGCHDSSKLSINHSKLNGAVSPRDVILADQGNLRLTIVEVNSRDIVCRAETDGTMRSGQGVYFPGLNLQDAFLSEQDHRLINFACGHGVDFIGLSFVECVADVEGVRALIGSQKTAIVAKVETQGALDNLDEILRVADAVMIDRGDLSVETNPESVALTQKHILSSALQVACPVIVATEMLKSMVDNRNSTQAEVSDITNAVLEGATALMLSEETAIGKFPVEAVAFMRRVADATSQYLNKSMKNDGDTSMESVPQAIGEAIELISRRLQITKIVAITISGYAARMLAATMPRQPILAVSNNPEAARGFNLLRGTKGIYVDIPFSRAAMDHVPRCLEELWRTGHLVDDDLILVTAVSYPKSGNRMNLIETHTVSDLRDSLGWSRLEVAPLP